MPFLDSGTCAEGGYLFPPGFSSLYDVIHEWMTGQMDGRKASFRPQRPLLYVICLCYSLFSLNISTSALSINKTLKYSLNITSTFDIE
jgi:hypothetical protein